jgi:hypothetical protein
MAMKQVRNIGLLLLLVLSPGAFSSQVDESFGNLLKEAGLILDVPEQYHVQAIQQTDFFPYEYALRHKGDILEIRYSVRPISRMEINYEDPHSSAPEPNHIFTMMFTALIGQFSSGGNSPHREYTLDEARQKFNADWAALSTFDIEPAYSADYKHAFLLALHKNNLSDAYLIILFDDYAQVKPHLDVALQSLRFK